MNKQKQIIDYALKIGFHQIGFGKARRFDELENIYKSREMLEFENDNIEMRINSELHFAGGKTFIALGYSYDLYLNNGLERDEIKVSSSLPVDYHVVMREKLSMLLNFVEEILGCSGKVFVDIEGLNDRQVAYECGIGYYGKNGHIISPYLGTNFNIGYLIIDEELIINAKIKSSCTGCNLCVDACPTGAILGEYLIDSKVCLSYITQKKKLDNIEEKLLNACIYGCDICQIVCPKNTVFARGEQHIFKICELLNSSNRKFKKKYGNRDFSWRGYQIIKRNVQLSIKNRDRDI